jgi:hypothetical protein
MADDCNDPAVARDLERDPKANASLSGCLIRILWMLVGPAALVFGAALIGVPRGESELAGHLLLFGSALGLIGLRHVDLTYLGGLRASGEPATPGDLRRYVGAIAVVTFMLWIVARFWQG